MKSPLRFLKPLGLVSFWSPGLFSYLVLFYLNLPNHRGLLFCFLLDSLLIGLESFYLGLGFELVLATIRKSRIGHFCVIAVAILLLPHRSSCGLLGLLCLLRSHGHHSGSALALGPSGHPRPARATSIRFWGPSSSGVCAPFFPRALVLTLRYNYQYRLECSKPLHLRLLLYFPLTSCLPQA